MGGVPVATRAVQVTEALLGPTAMRLRAAKNRRDLFGLHAPTRLLRDLVPPGRPAVDAGANIGLYSHVIALRASVVHAFEPNPQVFPRLAAMAGPRIRPYAHALSDAEGRAKLSVPQGSAGEASLHKASATGEMYEVECMTLDSLGLDDLGFMKVDVEGHESAVLSGAEQTLLRYRPVLFIELEERHAPGAVERVAGWLMDVADYRRSAFLLGGRLVPLAEYDPLRHQRQHADEPSSPLYVSNFVFWPTPMAPGY